MRDMERDVGDEERDKTRGEAEEKRRSVELVPFHGSLETIILIKLTTDPPHGCKGILRNDLPGTVETGGYRFNRRNKFYACLKLARHHLPFPLPVLPIILSIP